MATSRNGARQRLLRYLFSNKNLVGSGRDDLKEAVAAYIERRGGPRYDGRREIVITSGEGDAMLDALFCLTDPGDEVILTDPTYAGMLSLRGS